MKHFLLTLTLLLFAGGGVWGGTVSPAPAVISGSCGSSGDIVVTGSGTSAVIDGMDMANSCETDVQGPNDEPGQKDLNMYCAKLGPTSNSSFFYWSWDEINWSGKNTGDACILLDSNANGLVDLAICLSVHNNGEFMNMRLFRCEGDQATDRCFGSVELTPPADGFLTHCCVESNSAVDPFYDAQSSKKTGDNYPLDTLARCQVFLQDFAAPNIAFVDVCSYPSLQPNSDPSDCILTKFCSVDSDCAPRNDNGCWRGYCDQTLGVCRSEPLSAGTLCETSGNESFCDGKATCDGAGTCNRGSPLDCSSHGCGTSCQQPTCVEPTVFSVDTDASCGCEPNTTVSDCTGECGGNSECQSGTCDSAGVCQCSNLSGSCTTPSDGPCDVQCQSPVCSVGNCLCGNLPSTTLCESDPPNFCDGKSMCSNGACVTGPAPTCNGGCSTWCEKEVCQNPTVFAYNTDASCVCQSAPEREGQACESDGIQCTIDQCDNAGTCVHPPGECTGCAFACLVGTCTPNPSADEAYLVWDDGCRYNLTDSDGDQLPMAPPAGGTSDPICTNDQLQTLQRMASVFHGEPVSIAGIVMTVVGGVALVAAVALVIVAYRKSRANVGNGGVEMV